MDAKTTQQDWTPGPWVKADSDISVSGQLDSDDMATEITGWVVLHNSEMPEMAVIVCDVSWPNSWNDDLLDANTRIIAAAPSLVTTGAEMLTAFAESVEWSPEQRAAYEAFAAVIAQAIGENPDV